MNGESTASFIGYEWKKVGSLPPFSMPGVTADSDAPVQAENSGSQPRETSYEDGFTEGYEAGKLQGVADQNGVLISLQQVLEETQRLRERTATEGLSDIAAALQAIFTALFHYELQTSPDLIRAMARELSQVLKAEAEPKILLSRQDFELLSPVLPADLVNRVGTDEGLPKGVVRATTGKAMLELDVAANLEQVLANALTTSDEVLDVEDPDDHE